MSKRTRRVERLHQWTTEDQQDLAASVAACAPMLDHYRAHGYTEGDWWSMVAGDLRHSTDGRVAVTGLACKRAWDRVRATAAQQATQADRWAEVAAQIDAHERDRMEAMEAHLGLLSNRAAHIAAVVDAIARELGVPETWE